MELDRRFIERTEFSAVRKGYDPDEVDRHLREVAQAVDELKQLQAATAPTAAGSLAGAAAEQVRAIVEAAESSAAEIESSARAEAERVTGEAQRAAEEEHNTARAEAERMRREAEESARETRERAEADAGEHVARVQEATAGMRERADTVESELQGLVDELRSTIDSVIDRVRSSAGSLEAELEDIQANLTVVRDSSVEPAAQLEENEALAPEFEAAAEQTTKLTPVVTPGEEPETFDEEGEPEGAETLDEELEDEQELEPDEGTEAEDLVTDEQPAPTASTEGDGAEGARLIALNMALNGTPREETARYLEENFDLDDQEALLDEVYSRVGG